MYYLDVFCTVIDRISVCGSIPIEIPILWPRAVMVGPRPLVLLTLPLLLCVREISMINLRYMRISVVKFLK